MAAKKEKEESLMERLSDRLVKAIDPFYYEQSLVDSALRFIKGETDDEYILRLQKQMYPTALRTGAQEEWKEGDLAKGEIPPIIIRERLDMLKVSSGKKQEYNTIKKSRFKPSGAESKDEFYTFQDTNKLRDIYHGLKQHIPYMEKETKRRKSAVSAGSAAKEDKKKGFNVGYSSDVKKGESDFVNPNVIGMARYQIGVGEDEHGKYMSVYDEWDLDPGRGPIVEAIADAVMPGFYIYDRFYYEQPKAKLRKAKRKSPEIKKVVAKKKTGRKKKFGVVGKLIDLWKEQERVNIAG